MPLLCCSFVVSFAQTKADYQRVMDKFVKYYNARQGEKIVSMWEKQEKPAVERLWTKHQVDTLQMKYGKILSFQFDSTQKTQYGAAAFFKVKFSKLLPNGSSFIVNKRNEFTAFELFTSEPKWLEGKTMNDKIIKRKK
jgi:hypothetical protein